VEKRGDENMEYRKTADGFAISDINIAAGMLCADGVSFKGLEPRAKGNGYLFLLMGDPDKLEARYDDWFHGRIHGDLHKFADMVTFVKDKLFDEKRKQGESR